MEEILKGVGPSKARYAIVGDNWTKLGAKLGQPFTGSGESLLTSTLQALNLKSECFLTNAVPFVTTRNVSKGDVDLHRDILYEELRAHECKVVLACGTWAAYALTYSQKPITEQRGGVMWNVELQAYVIVTLHPGAIVYNPAQFADFSADVAKLPVVAEMEPGLEHMPEPNLYVVEEWADMTPEIRQLLMWPDDNVASVDIETEGFDFMRQDILSIGIGPTENDVVIFGRGAIEHIRGQAFLTELFRREDIEWVYQNGKFDIKFMRADPDPEIFGHEKKCVIPTARCDFDTMLAHYCLDERQMTHGLKVWAREEFFAPDWEADIKQYLPTKDTPYSAIPKEVMYKYQSFDVYYTRKGRYRFLEKMREDSVLQCFNTVYRPAVEAFAEIELAGIPIDYDRMVELYQEAQPRIAAAEKALQDAAVAAGWDPCKYAAAKNEEKLAKWVKENAHLDPEKQARKPGGTEIPKVFNPKSHPQLSYVAYDLCGLPPFEGKKTCAKEAVDEYRHRHPFWKALAEYKEASDLFGTFIKGMLERTDPDNRIRPDFLLHGTRTGRISCQNPNMQNLPRGSVVKDFFVADPGCVVVNADYKTLEVVIAAILSNDKAMQQPFIEGADFHSQTARNVFASDLEMLEHAVAAKDRRPIDEFLERTLMLEIRQHVHEQLDAGDFDGAMHSIWKHLRFLTKFVTFGIMYGRGAQSLAHGELNCSVREAEGYMATFFKGYPNFSRWLKLQEHSAIHNGYVQNVFGFKRRWPLVTNDIMHEIRNQSWNTPVQGSASMVCMMALCRAQKYLTEVGWGRVLFTVHDSIVYSIREDVLQDALTYIHDNMVKDVIGTPVRLEAELEVGPSYKKVEPWVKVNGIWQPEEA